MIDDYNQIYHDALVALMAGLTTENENGICWEDRYGKIQIKRFGKQLRITTKDDAYWFLNNKLHREDGPAIEHSNGSRWWYQNGLRHRCGGPAVECADGSKFWYKNGEIYTDDK